MPKSETQRLYWCHLEIIQAKWHAVTEQYQRSTSGKLIFKPGRHEKMDSNLRQIIHALPRTTSFHCFQRNEREVFWGTVYSRTNKKITTLYQPCLTVEILLCWIRSEQKNFWKWLNLQKYLSCSQVSVCYDTLQASSTNVQAGSYCTSPGTRWACHQADKSQAALTAWLPKPASLWLTEKW